MSTDQASDWAAFNQFVQHELGSNLNGLTLEDSLTAFRAYQHDLESLRTKLQVAEEQSARGESKPLDRDAFWKRVDNRLDEKGISE